MENAKLFTYDKGVRYYKYFTNNNWVRLCYYENFWKTILKNRF